jgi:hypothetical protein
MTTIMRPLLFVLLLGSCSAAALAACSSSSDKGGGGGADAGTRDGTTTHAEGGGSDGGGGQDAGTIDASPGVDGSSPEAAADTGSATDGGSEGGVVEAGSDGETEAGPDASGDGGTIEDAAVECGSTPTLHVDEAGSVYCGFQSPSDLYCVKGQECCLGGALGDGSFASQQCQTLGTTCTNVGVPDAGAPAIPVACMQIADCKANGETNAVACCLQGGTVPADQTGCLYPRSSDGTAVVCETSDAGATGAAACATGEIQMCSSAADCPAGKTCTPGKWKIFDVGFCL